MQTLSQSGSGVYYRTKLMELNQAASFARCLGANPAFAQIAIEESAKAKSARKFYVTFLPANFHRVEEMLDREQDARRNRAEGEGESYVFCPGDDGRFWWVFNPKSGETYEVTERSCTCADHQFRCRQNGLRCKHQLRLLAVLQEDAAPPYVPDEERAEETLQALETARREQARARMLVDFPAD